MFAIDRDTDSLEKLSPQELSDLNVLERRDLQEWIIDEPRLLGDDYLVVTSEFAGFEDTLDRLDILALDRSGDVVVVELKRGTAEPHVDLQAIKYASYCATLTAQQLQEEYRSFWSDRGDSQLAPEEVGDEFANFVGEWFDGELGRSENGFVNFDLDNKPRILIAAKEFGTEVTSPVMWLIEEYGLDITCVRLQAFEHAGELLLQGREIIPVREAEEYMTKRREKEESQSKSDRRKRGVIALLERGVLREGDIVRFDDSEWSNEFDQDYAADSDYWRARVTGKRGRSNNVEWLHDGEEYSFTRITKELLAEQTGRDTSLSLNGYKYWVHPEFDDRTLSDLRNSKVEKRQRKRGSDSAV
jgi:hypothetical protein